MLTQIKNSTSIKPFKQEKYKYLLIVCTIYNHFMNEESPVSIWDCYAVQRNLANNIEFLTNWWGDNKRDDSYYKSKVMSVSYGNTYLQIEEMFNQKKGFFNRLGEISKMPTQFMSSILKSVLMLGTMNNFKSNKGMNIASIINVSKVFYLYDYIPLINALLSNL